MKAKALVFGVSLDMRQAPNMSQPTTNNPASAQPIKGLSKRAQEMVKPRRYGPPIAPRYQGEIPQAFRSSKG